MDKYKDFPISYFIYKTSIKQRVFYHLLFWIVFLCFHQIYFLVSKDKLYHEPSWAVSYAMYYMRFIPVYYSTVAVFKSIRNYFRPITQILITLLCLVVIMHLVTVTTYVLLEKVYSLHTLSPALHKFGSIYLTPPAHRNFNDWQTLLFFDIGETQVLFLPLGLKMIKYSIEAELEKRDLINDKLVNDVRTLRLQPAPHFTLNAINAAHAEVLPANPRAARYLEKLAGVLRFSLYRTNNDWVSVADEWKALLDYVHLEVHRFKPNVECAVQQITPIMPHHQAPTLILFTLAENAFKHGVYPSIGPCWVKLSLQIINDVIYFEISNSKPKAPSEPARAKDFGIGFANIEKRLKLHFNTNYTFTCTDRAESFEVRLSFPLR